MRNNSFGRVATALLCLNCIFATLRADEGGGDRAAADGACSTQALRSDDGFRLFADFCEPLDLKQPAPVVILLHSFRSDRSVWKPLVPALRQAGFAVMAIDLRGHGESSTTEAAERVNARDPELLLEMQADVRAAYVWLSKRSDVDRARIAVMGTGSGCGVALQYAALDRSVDGVVCISPELEFLGLKPEQDIKQIQGRKILLVSSVAEQESCDKLAQLSDSASKKLLGGSAHGPALLNQNSGAVRDLVDFLRQATGHAGKNMVYGSINSNVYHEAGSGWIAEVGTNNLRVYSSPAEAEERGLRPSRSTGPEDRRRNRARRG